MTIIKKKPFLSILHYAALTAVALLCAFLVFSITAYSNLQQLRIDIEEQNNVQASRELHRSIEYSLKRADSALILFSQWQEALQQLENPTYYLYWRGHRMMTAGVLPDYVVGAELYDKNGKILGQAQQDFPSKLSFPVPEPIINIRESEPEIMIFKRLLRAGSQGETIGYAALRIQFFPKLGQWYNFQHIDSSTLVLDKKSRDYILPTELPRFISYKLRTNPMNSAIDQVVSDLIIQLTCLLAVLSLLILPSSMLILISPLQSLSRYIDYLQRENSPVVLKKLSGWFSVAETEKIREQLNQYQAQLKEAYSTLEVKNHELWEQAHIDSLTGVHNRRAFEEYQREVSSQEVTTQQDLCVVLIDIDHFKSINDSYGHEIGDRLLVAIADEICNVLHKKEFLYRIGADEFVVILHNTNEQGAFQFADRCQSRITQFNFNLLGINEPVHISIGMAFSGASERAVISSLLWQANIAMNNAKKPGNASIMAYTGENEDNKLGLFSSWLYAAVIDAVLHKKEGLVIYYQPVVNVLTETIPYYEGLVRIVRDGECIPPSKIFPLIETHRLEIELDRAVFKQILKDLKEAKIPENSGVSINLSAPMVVHDQLIDWLDDFIPLLKQYSIVLEVTETALITQINRASENLKALRAMGFKVALDDFGSGYSSILYLATMPVDIVKFDITLIQGLQDSKQKLIVTHLASMIIKSGPLLVAEGVETKETLEAVRRIGFRYVQGFLFGKPDILVKKHICKALLKQS